MKQASSVPVYHRVESHVVQKALTYGSIKALSHVRSTWPIYLYQAQFTTGPRRESRWHRVRTTNHVGLCYILKSWTLLRDCTLYLQLLWILYSTVFQFSANKYTRRFTYIHTAGGHYKLRSAWDITFVGYLPARPTCASVNFYVLNNNISVSR